MRKPIDPKRFDWRDEDGLCPEAETNDGWAGEVFCNQGRWFGRVETISPDHLTSCEMQCSTEHRARAFCNRALTFLRREAKFRGEI